MSSRMLTVSSVYPNSCIKPVPAVRVQGKWLENIGFHVGCKVEIYESDGEITIKLAESDCNTSKSSETAENKKNSPKNSKSKKQTQTRGRKVLYG
ncbi:type I toxin-antitoxin system toxin SymE [Ruminiclostridium sufflavum DSM 19573]|uniref:Type I toxin-antitoxin system toxin SymE n=1 Tax=Ruminiclostridium sufflavum DSM 19573 TaxID=1121337 RepID=A0A318XIB0_9FIRM|nr:SymE family type I addiction module toxin [Ruminiclostridium sufflavum]PYG83884.1 type I toxin-antitoxin system toxin SymE [Ruminiclostridium sufflavum DSM 19573]